MPKICIDLWQKIWRMSDQYLVGARAFITDFELYDARAVDSLHTALDIFIGIK
jgi:predicted transcriptional regulator YdeE